MSSYEFDQRTCSALGCRVAATVVVRHPTAGPRAVCETHSEEFGTEQVIRHV